MELSSVYIKVQEVVTFQSWKDILTHLIHCNEVKFEVSTCGLNLVDWLEGGGLHFMNRLSHAMILINKSCKVTWFLFCGFVLLV